METINISIEQNIREIAPNHIKMLGEALFDAQSGMECIKSPEFSKYSLTQPISSPTLNARVEKMHCDAGENVMPISPKDALELLEGKRIEVSALSDLSKESRAVVTLDQQSVGRLSRMDAMQGQAMAQEAQRRREIELQRIEQAVKRLDDGDFGYCVECDAEIPLKRLEIDPAASHCVKCAALLEKKKNN